MALMNCRECGNQVSTAAQTCPKCGAPTAGASATTKTPWYYSGGLVLLLLFCFWPVGLILMWTGKVWTLRTRVLATSLVVLTMAAIGILGEDAKTSPPSVPAVQAEPITEAAPTPAPEPEPPETPESVGIAEMLSEYKDNEVRADSRYKGRLVRTRGKVDDVKKDILGDPYVTIGTGKRFEVPVVQCFFAEGELGKASELSKGTMVTVSGRVSGLMMNVIVKDCRIE